MKRGIMVKLDIIEPKSILTDRINVSYLSAGNKENQVLLLVHGNVSSNLFWLQTIQALSRDYYVIAPDLRGYGKTEGLPIDATRGVKDWSGDLKSFVESLGINKPFHMLGWSLGGGIIMQYAIDYPLDLASLVLVNPVSPYGFGGTKDLDGTPCTASYSGTGAGGVNPDFVDRLTKEDRTEESANSPLSVMNQFYFKPPFRAPKDIEEIYLSSMLSTRIGDDFYPGNFEACNDWPNVAPGGKGINNAFSPKYMNTCGIIDIEKKVPILWIRGESDMIVSDQSFFDFGYLGKLGLIPDWPGNEVYPPQPMVAQIRHVLDKYKKNGGSYIECVIEDTGHSPHIEKPQDFQKELFDFLKNIG